MLASRRLRRKSKKNVAIIFARTFNKFSCTATRKVKDTYKNADPISNQIKRNKNFLRERDEALKYTNVQNTISKYTFE